MGARDLANLYDRLRYSPLYVDNKGINSEQLQCFTYNVRHGRARFKPIFTNEWNRAEKLHAIEVWDPSIDKSLQHPGDITYRII